MTLWWLGTACVAPGVVTVHGQPLEDTAPVGDTDSGATGVEVVPDPACPHPSNLYDPTCVVRYDLVIDPASWGAMQTAYDRAAANCGDTASLRVQHPAVLNYGPEVRDVTIRLKGNACTFLPGGKMQLRIDLNDAAPGTTFHDVTAINLEASNYDPTAQKNGLAFQVFRDAGLVDPQSNFALLYVNDELYAVYENVEQINGQFLDNHYADSTGNLYSFIWNGSYGDLQSNEGVADVSRWTAMQALVDATPGTVSLDEFDARFAAFFDIDQLLLAMAAEAVVPQVDGIWAGSANCYVYDDPAGCGGAGCMQYLPWDLDSAFVAPPLDLCPACGTSPETEEADPFTFISGRGPGARWRAVELLLQIPARRAQFVVNIHAILDVYDPEVLRERQAARFAQIDAYQSVDPKVDYDRFVSSNEELAAFFADRRAFLDGWVAAQP